jgi:ketosteroid isomerase-like protein
MNEMGDDVLKVNQAFYDAFAAGDFPAMETLWAGFDEVSVIHPGNTALHGRKDVMMSWQQILENSGGSGVRCTSPRAYILGDIAYVVCSEVFPEGQLIATNIFVLEDGEWRMVHHQAGPDNQISRATSDFTSSVH